MFAVQLRAAGQPAIVRDFAGRAGWTASTAWAWPSLAQADVRLPNVYHKPNPFFRHYTKRKPYAAILDVQPDFDVLNMTAPELVAILNETDRGYYCRSTPHECKNAMVRSTKCCCALSREAPNGRGADWSGPAAMLGPAVANAVEPHQPLVLEPDKAMYQAWISSKVRIYARSRCRRLWWPTPHILCSRCVFRTGRGGWPALRPLLQLFCSAERPQTVYPFPTIGLAPARAFPTAAPGPSLQTRASWRGRSRMS